MKRNTDSLQESKVPEFVCKIPDSGEMERKWNYEIAHASDPASWRVWKESHMENARQGKSIPCYGFLNGQIICEATAMLSPDIVQNPEGLVDGRTAYLCAFRTVEEFQGRGYFSRLFRFLLEVLRERGYERLTLGVEPEETKNLAIYRHWGFTGLVKSAVEHYPDGSTVRVDYYERKL